MKEFSQWLFSLSLTLCVIVIYYRKQIVVLLAKGNYKVNKMSSYMHICVSVYVERNNNERWTERNGVIIHDKFAECDVGLIIISAFRSFLIKFTVFCVVKSAHLWYSISFILSTLILTVKMLNSEWWQRLSANIRFFRYFLLLWIFDVITI